LNISLTEMAPSIALNHERRGVLSLVVHIDGQTKVIEYPLQPWQLSSLLVQGAKTLDAVIKYGVRTVEYSEVVVGADPDTGLQSGFPEARPL